MSNTVQAEEPTTKVGHVLAQLRSQITRGMYKPGERFPTFDEMGEQFQVSRAVLQQAIRQLRRDGFVRTVSRQGMYVSENPPHLTRHALILPGDENRLGYSRLVKALLDAAESASRANPDRQYVVYERAMDPEEALSVRRRLAEDIRMQRLVGLVFAPGTMRMLETCPEVETSDFPRVFLGESPKYGARPTVGADTDMFYRRALKRLAERGRRRVAIIHMAGTATDVQHADLYADVGLDYHAPWIQMIGRSHPVCIQGLLRLLFDPASGHCPDSLIIADDNLVEHATAGLMRLGLRVGEDIDVVAYAHWPWREPCVLPVHRLGFDMGEMMRRSMDVIQNVRDGAPTPDHQLIPAVFESELNTHERTAVASIVDSRS